MELGDAISFSPVANAIAVQKQGGVQSDDGFEFEQYDLFFKDTISLPSQEQFVYKKTHHHNPNITVNRVDVTGISTSSLVQVGNLDHIDAETRLKHIRILSDEQNKNNQI